jgi:hypothetical protein
MHNLTREEQRTISRYLSESRGRIDTFFTYAIYFVPSLAFGLYGMLKADFLAVAMGYVALVGLVIYLIVYQRRSAPLFRSAIRKLVESGGATDGAAAEPPSRPSL